LLERHADEVIDDGRRGLVRHGHLPEREIMTGIGPVAVRCPRMRDRVREGSERIRFSWAILLPYAPRSKSLEVLIPILYLKGISTGEFEEALAVLLGKDAGGQSASTVARLKDAWSEERVRWSNIIGATPEGKKELVGLIWHNERHRKRIRNDPPSHRALQGGPL
jgi:putative transposase